jgi:hypothetical protein
MLKRQSLFVLLLACAATQALSQGAPSAPASPAEPAQGQAHDDAKRGAEEKRAQAKLEQEKEAKARREQLLSQCAIRPVMSDEDIAKCRAAYAVN